MKKRKAIFTLDTLGNAGTEKSMLDILSHFSENTEIVVVYFFSGDDLKTAYEKAGIRLRYEPVTGGNAIYKGIRKLVQVMREEKPDVVVSSILRANLISRIACRITGVPLVGTFISDSYSALRKSSFGFKRKLGAAYYYRLDRITAGIPVGWISNSASIRESNCAYLGIKPEKVTVIYRGRDPGKFRPKENVLIPGRFRFIYLGRLLETKGLKELLEAFRRISHDFPFASLDVYGQGNFRGQAESIVQLAGMANRVFFHGVVPNGWEKLYDADCFVFPSWYEGFSGSLVEAMMVGIPIIASDIPMNLEAVTPDVNALVYPVKQADALQDCMRKAIEDYPSMQQKTMLARREAIERFDIASIASQYEDYIFSVSGKFKHT